MIKAFLFSVLLQASAAHGWVSRGHVALAAYHPPTAGLRMAGGDNEIPVSPELMETDDPCWQNMLDDDCSMGNVYAANFVASKWIKSMPCGKGIEDCDMPTELSSPDARPEAGVDHVDVMKFLGLKRAVALNVKKNDDSSGVSP